jgi:hypothetical protein
MADACADEADPGLFFGGARSRPRRAEWKVLQLCRQVERAAAFTLACDCASDVLAGAALATVEPAPDAARLRLVVVLGPGKGLAHLDEAARVLRARAAAFREEAARSIHRKRAPEIVFDVRLGAEGELERND